MSFQALHKLVAYLLSGLGLLSLSLGAELSAWTLGLLLLGYAGSYFAEGELLGRAGYARAWTASVVALLAAQVLRAALTEPTLAMAIEFAAYLQISRLWNRRSAADYQQIAVLAFLHLVAATVLSTSLSYALIFIGFVIATPWMLALSQLRREIEGNYPAASAGDDKARAAVERVLASKRVVGAAFLVRTALLALPLFAMTLAIFVVVPRVGQGFLSLRRSEGDRVAGFGNQIELGGFGVIRDDPTVVVRVRPPRAPSQPPPPLGLRLRGTSFDSYDGFRWTRSPHAPRPLGRLGADQYPIRRRPDPARDQAYEIILDHLDEPVVFLPSGTVALRVAPRVAHGRAQPRRLAHLPGLDLRYVDSDSLGLIYTAYVSSEPRDADIVPIAPERRADYLEVPPGHERVARLARELTAGAKSPTESAERLVSHLHARYTYTLELPDVGRELPLDAFLFRARRGHCEYFASALAIMLRTLGIPARNVTGFVGGVYNTYGGYYALRQGDAHSWVEAYIEGRGFVTYDPTPPSRANLGPRITFWADLRALADALRTRWVTSVVGYDLRTQVGLLRKLMDLFASRNLAAQGAPGSVERSLSSLRGLLRAGGVALALVALVTLAVYLRRRGRRQAARRAPLPHVARAVGLYRELERALEKHGRRREPSVTPVEHARRLAAERFEAAADVALVTEHYMRVRYGGQALSPGELADIAGALERVRAIPRRAA